MIIIYEEKYEKEWDDLVLNDSINGNFLQTRNFLNYHEKDKFVDHSLMFYKEDKLVAVLPANEVENGQILISHQGSTYGGLIVRKLFASTVNYNWIFEEMIEYFKKKKYHKVHIYTPNWLYRNDNKRNELLDYYYQIKGFQSCAEIGFYIDMSNLEEGYEKCFDKLRRRKLSKAYKENLIFKELKTDEELGLFYEVLVDNMLKFKTNPIHTYEELLEFWHYRLKDITFFYGVFLGEVLIAGSMVWNFCNKKVFHTQYLASRQNYLVYSPNEFLYTKLIEEARKQNYKYLSYGTASLEHGKIYNEGLGRYKEGYNTDTYMNKSYTWINERNT